ncbi:MAG: class II aldolase/adducin family protein [Lachnospiraceae bacterium]|nr:class II aldolase/adducin family protein [Lachnospiraceae bacterium]
MKYSKAEGQTKVLNAGLELQRTKLIARTWGNISARISDTQFVITPSGRAYDTLSPEDIVTVNIKDGAYEGHIKPSIEKMIHAAAYRNRPEAGFVIHTHQNYGSSISTMERDLDLTHLHAGVSPTDVDRLGGELVPCASYAFNGSQELADALEEQMRLHPNAKAFFMQHHGVLCIGKDYEEAFAAAHALERICEAEYRVLTGELFPDTNRPYQNFLSGSRTEDGRFVVISQTPFVTKYSELGKELLPFIDDYAQIIGLRAVSLPEHAGAAEITAALKESNAALVKGHGAICVGRTSSDAEAAAIVLEKNCIAALLAEKCSDIRPLSEQHAAADHEIYVNQYAKRITENR